MFLPKVRFNVEGSVSAVKVSGSRSTVLTSSNRVTSHNPTDSTQLTGSFSRSSA